MHAGGKNESGEFKWSHNQLKHAGLFVEVEYFTRFSCLSLNAIFFKKIKHQKCMSCFEKSCSGSF